jgi:hypothetical protein
MLVTCGLRSRAAIILLSRNSNPGHTAPALFGVPRAARRSVLSEVRSEVMPAKARPLAPRQVLSLAGFDGKINIGSSSRRLPSSNHFITEPLEHACRLAVTQWDEAHD